MFRASQPFLAVVVMVLAVPAVRGDPPSTTPLTREFLNSVRAETSRLAHALENLQGSIVEELGGQKERTLYRKADAALAALGSFESSLKDSASSKRLSESFDSVDRKIRDLLDAVAALGPDARALHREASRVSSTEEDLYFMLSAGDSSAGQTQQVLKRQARRLVDTARELERTAQYALLKVSGQTSPGDFHRLVEVSARFQKSVAAGARLEDLRKDFAEVSSAWQKAVQVLKMVKPGENLYLLRTAARLDRLHARLHQLLGIKSDRPGLTIRT